MAIQSLKLPTGETIIVNEWISIPRFSTCEFGSDVDVNLRIFNYVVGARVPQQGTIPGAFTGRNATTTDTNQSTRARLNQDQAYLVYSITYEVFGLDDADIPSGSPTGILQAGAPVYSSNNLRRLQRDLVISLTMGANIIKPQARMPFAWIGQGPGALQYPSGDTPLAGVAYSGGTGSGLGPASQRNWPLPVFIAPDRAFYMAVKSERSPRTALAARQTQTTRLRFYVDGMNRRPIA